MGREYGTLSTMYYEHTKPVGFSIAGDIELYARKFDHLSGRVLEAGVGTGRMLIPLLERGVAGDGVDSSPEMLKQCRAHLEQRGLHAALFEQELAELSLPHTYEAIIMPAGSFCLLPKERAQEILASFYQHLNPGGQLILDLEMPLSFQAGTTHTNTIQLTATRSMVLTSTHEKIDWVAQKTTYTNTYELREDGVVVHTETAPFILYWYGIAEFEMLLSKAGYSEITTEIEYGDTQPERITYTAHTDHIKRGRDTRPSP